MQFQIGDDLRVKQADGVCRDRIAEAGMEFLGHGRPARDRAAFDHLNAQAGHCQIGGACEAVMPSADDDDIRLCHVRFKKG